jgi:hypothetical protein
LIGDEVQVFSVSSTTPPRHFWSKDKKINFSTLDAPNQLST